MGYLEKQWDRAHPQRSKSTPHSLRCNCYARPCKCDYSNPRPVLQLRKLEIPTEPERMVKCALGDHLYIAGTGTRGVCPKCMAGFRAQVGS